MTDITRLLASLKRRSAHAKDFGDDITFVKLKDIDALVEALEREVAMREQNLAIKLHMSERIAELESRTVTVKQGEVLVTVAGFTGCGKSAIAGEIEIAMKA
ncbi:hypothetical protein ACN6UI_05715, partial [Klebsiella aerogenes]